MDAWMIEEILKQEEARRREEDSARPQLEIPVPPPGWEPQKENKTEGGNKVERGVVVIDFSI